MKNNITKDVQKRVLQEGLPGIGEHVMVSVMMPESWEDNNFDILLDWHLALNYKLLNLLTRYLGRVDIIIEIQTKK